MSTKTLKNGPQKLFIIGPDPFISQSSLDHNPQPTAQPSPAQPSPAHNWFFILWNLISGPDICSLICDRKHLNREISLTFNVLQSYALSFYRSQNFLGPTKNRTAFSCLIAPVEKLNLPYGYHLWTGTKTNWELCSISINFWFGKKYLDPPKTFWDL